MRHRRARENNPRVASGRRLKLPPGQKPLHPDLPPGPTINCCRTQGEEEPGIRTARLRLLEPGGKSLAEEDDNEDGEEGEAPAWNPGPRKKGKAAKAAASVEGAHARISRWPPPVDAAGFAPDQAAVGPPPSGWPSALSKKDATAFLRAARRYLHPGRLAEMAGGEGGDVLVWL